MKIYQDPNQADRLRPQVLAAFEASMEEFDDLYQKLAC